MTSVVPSPPTEQSSSSLHQSIPRLAEQTMELFSFLALASILPLPEATAFAFFASTPSLQSHHLSQRQLPLQPTTTSALFSAVIANVAVINIGEYAERDTSSMEQWASSSGIQRADGFKLRSNDRYNKDVCAFATQDIPSGTPVLFVPEALILSSSKAMSELRTLEMQQAEQMLDPTVDLKMYYLMVKLLSEIEKGSQSAWFPWFNALPRYFENAISMTTFCITCLPKLMKKISEDERFKQRNLSSSAMKAVPYLSSFIKSDEKLVKWVYQIATTRSFETEEGDLRIVPMADMMNHGDYAEVEPWYDDEGNYYGYSTYDVPANSPIRLSYGDSNNPSSLMAKYGFLDENAPATNCKLVPPEINQDMICLGYAEDKMLFYSTGEVAEESGEEKYLVNAHNDGDYDAKQILHQRYYADTSALLLDHIDSFVQELDKLSAKADTIAQHEVNWKEATAVVSVLECNDFECAEAQCVLDDEGNWTCEGGLGYNEDGSERATSKTILSAE
ncbi:predicted protein [Thalassiosira pseudonana CCMP1335]|uniref:Uncharacterized protein n=1 Tax=Thalassiosira pseudonana TaxID=35128 RepID=B8C899_THAPS|nr:predicted protein [Thalassiosira pseudonana CCMP1335]EED90249.1 predicted protein [Thalassiosira pseudonana CCMP1335]